MINGTAITIGKFDGFHLGHQVLLNDISEKAGEKNLEAVCCKLRFSGCNIMSTNEEDSFLKNRFPKIDRIEYIDFTPEFAAMSPDEFVRDYLVQRLSVAYVVVGNDFRFGKDRAGDAETLKSLGKKYGFEVRICDKLLIDGSVVSSTRVRENLAKGNVENASRLLGYTYELNGVYASLIYMSDSKKTESENKVSSQIDGIRVYKGITNIGIRPSIDDGDRPTVETFIYDFNEDIYGETVRVVPVHYIRPEQAFKNLDELVEQINKDIEVAKSIQQ